MEWRWADASERGTSHIRSGDKLQDHYYVSKLGGEHILAVVADGAGSAKFGDIGAAIVCYEIKSQCRSWLSENDGLPDNETVSSWIDDLRDKISRLAEKRKTTRRQFAATLAALLISPSEILTLHIGDSAIVGRCGSEWGVICWPENGEYASTTYFVTDDPEPRLNIIRLPSSHDAFALFSDGVGDLALSHAERKAHTLFFGPMMRPVDSSTVAGRLPELSGKLQEYLASAPVCERTDDDKTLILLSRA